MKRRGWCLVAAPIVAGGALVGCGGSGGPPIDGWLPVNCSERLGLTSETGRRLAIDRDIALDVWPSAPDAGGPSIALDPADRSPAPAAEGVLAHCAVVTGGAAGWGLRITSPVGRAQVAAFAGGTLAFQMATDDVSRLSVGMKWAGGSQELPLRDYVSGDAAVSFWRWTAVRIPVAAFGADLSTSVYPFLINADPAPNSQLAFCVDDVKLEPLCGAGAWDGGGSDSDDASADQAFDQMGPNDVPGAASCPELVPANCLLSGAGAAGGVHGILNECKQDVPLSDPGVITIGKASVGKWNAAGATSSIDPSLEDPYEGKSSVCLTTAAGAAAMFVYYPTADGAAARNFSDFAGGRLEFAVRTSADLAVEIAWRPPGATMDRSARVRARDFAVGTTGSWSLVSIPFCRFSSLDLSVITTLVSFVIENQTATPSTACVDAVRYRRPLGCPESCSAPEPSPEPAPEAPPEPAPDAAVDRFDGFTDVPAPDSGPMDAGWDAPETETLPPPAACSPDLVPAACVSPGTKAEDSVFGIFLDCKQSVALDQPGGGAIGLYQSVTGGAQILSAPSGVHQVCTRVTTGAASSFVYVLPTADGPKTLDLSAFASGYLEAAVTGDDRIMVGLSWLNTGAMNESRAAVPAADYVVGTRADGWRQIRIPLCAFRARLAGLVGLATFAIDPRSTETTYCWDAVRFRAASPICHDDCTGPAPSVSR